jgi:ribonuclease D
VRRLAWQPPARPDPTSVADRLAAAGARPWQIELCAAPLSAVLSAAPAE